MSDNEAGSCDIVDVYVRGVSRVIRIERVDEGRKQHVGMDTLTRVAI